MRTAILLLFPALLLRAEEPTLLSRLDAELREITARAEGALFSLRAGPARPGLFWTPGDAKPRAEADLRVIYLSEAHRVSGATRGAAVLVGSPPRLVAAWSAGEGSPTEVEGLGPVRRLGGDEELGICLYSVEAAGRQGLAPLRDAPVRGGLALHIDRPGGTLSLAPIQSVDPLTGVVTAAVRGGILVSPKGELMGLDPGGIFVGVDGQYAMRTTVTGFLSGALVARLLEDVEKHGRIRRGYLGVVLGAGGAEGVLVSSVLAGSPAAAAGIRPGRRIESLDGCACRDPEILARALAGRPPGESVRVGLAGEGTVAVVLADREDAKARLASPEGLGLDGQDLTPDLLRFLGIPEGTRGVVVVAVREGSIFAAAGVGHGDVIVGAGGPVADLEELRAAVAAAKGGLEVRWIDRATKEIRQAALRWEGDAADSGGRRPPR